MKSRVTYNRSKVGSSTTRLLVAVLRAPRILAALAALACAPFAQAADFYVAMPAPDGIGDDSNPGTSALPFATIGAAITAADAAIVGGDTSATIHVFDGTYTENSLTLANPITVVGESGDRDAVIVDADKVGRTFTLNHASATLSGITIRNGKTPSNNTDFGGNILISAAGGIVTNCVVSGGIANNGGNISIVESDAALVVDSTVSGGDANRGELGNGGNIYAKGGRVSRCVISNGISRAGFSSGEYGGANIHVARWDSHAGVVENCLVTGGECTSQGHGSGIHVTKYATAKIVNCTIVKNLPGSNNRAAVYLHSQSSNPKIVNCVIYDNGGTAATEWGNVSAARFYSCATASGAAISGGTDNIATLTDASFKDYANDDYHPVSGSVLVDAGCDPSSHASGCATDLDGVARPSGDACDIGCYEFDWSAVSVDVTFAASAIKVLIGESVTFTPQVFGAAGPFTFKWNFDDGAGDETSSAATMTHAFATAGLHYPTVSVSTDNGSTWAASYTATAPVQTAPAVLWLDVSNASPAYPYATEVTAATNLVDALSVLTNAAGALAMDGVTIRVKPGTYMGAGYPELSTSVTILGVGDRDAVIFDANQAGRAFVLNHAAATLSGITIRSGKLPNSSTDFGGNILVSVAGGIVTNCVVSGGIANNGGNISMESDEALVVDSTVSGGDANYGERGNGGNIYLKGGRVSRCVVSDGISRAGFGTGNYGGANIHVARWDGHTPVVENCLVTGGEFTSQGQGSGIHVIQHASTRIVNCTIVKNLPGSNNRAAVYLNSTSASAVNCAIYGNGGTAATEWGNVNGARFVNCATASDAAISGGTDNITTLTDADFKNYAGGNYLPKTGGALVNAGTNELYASYAISATDLAGNPRIIKKIIDIGCYEIASGVGLSIFVR